MNKQCVARSFLRVAHMGSQYTDFSWKTELKLTLFQREVLNVHRHSFSKHASFWLYPILLAELFFTDGIFFLFFTTPYTFVLLSQRNKLRKGYGNELKK